MTNMANFHPPNVFRCGKVKLENSCNTDALNQGFGKPKCIPESSAL